MTESERRPERNPGDYDPAEDPDTDAPASGERVEREGDDAGSREEDAGDDDGER